jgi:cell division protein FtsW
MFKTKPINRSFFIVSLILVVLGFITFFSATLGQSEIDVARTSIFLKSQFVALLVGVIICAIISFVPYTFYKKIAFYIYSITTISLLLVFTPLGTGHGGAKRWLDLGITQIQPLEFMKIGFVLFFAYIVTRYNKQITESIKNTILVYLFVALPPIIILLIHPDVDGAILIHLAALAILFAGGIKKRTFILFIVGSLLGLVLSVVFISHVRDRFVTHYFPNQVGKDSSYQIDNASLAIGSGGIFGRGLGQSTFKYRGLPEPTSDSIFAIYAEEFGFWGSVFLIILFLLFSVFGLRIARDAPDLFGRLIVVGFVIIIIVQAFINIGAIVSIIPLAGLPLVFFSKGGSALVMVLTAIGIIFNISRYKKQI